LKTAAARLEARFDDGLREDEVLERRAVHGENRMTPKAGKGPILRLALQFGQPLVLVLLLAGTVTALLGEWVDAGVIFGVTLINAVIGFIQEGRAENALAALARSIKSEVTVLRGGCKQRPFLDCTGARRRRSVDGRRQGSSRPATLPGQRPAGH
jgi:cation-transporting ATPase F